MMYVLSFESIFRLLAVLKCPSNVSRYSSFIIHCAGYQVHLLRRLESHDLEERTFVCSLNISSKPVSPFHFLELLLLSYFITLVYPSYNFYQEMTVVTCAYMSLTKQGTWPCLSLLE